MRRSTQWLRISYWVGAVADGIAAIVMLSQAILAHESPLTHYTPQEPYRYAMGLAGSLMLGWTFLLLWANRKPHERRGVLMITNLVISGLIGSGIYAMYSNFAPSSSILPVLAFQIVLIVLFTYSYMVAGSDLAVLRDSAGVQQDVPADSPNARR